MAWSRKRIVLVPSLLMVILLLGGTAIIADDIIKIDSCANLWCPMVARGEMSWWTALLVYGCWCDSGGQPQGTQQGTTGKAAVKVPPSGPTCSAARLKVIGHAK